MGIFFRNSVIQYEISEIQYENMGIFPHFFQKSPNFVPYKYVSTFILL
jgi:hypothetical protein